MGEQKNGASRRLMVFVGLCLACVTVAGSYVWFARHRLSTNQQEALTPASPAPSIPDERAATARPRHRPTTRRLVFCDVSTEAHRGRLATFDLDGSSQGETRFYNQLSCIRADFRSGRGICLRLNPITPMNPNEAVIFNKDFKIQHIIPLAGAVSRARVSPDGRWGAVTVFTSGDSYASDKMSTRTILLDMQHGATLFNLEDMVVRNKGTVFKEADFNFWGVTFAQDNQSFYATLATGGKIYLIKGNRLTREADVICENIECPSLSPDNTRIAFKKRSSTGTRGTWHLAVLNLDTLQEIVLPEPESIDQQVQWFDNRHVMYALPETIVGQPVFLYTWIIAADGNSPPKKLLKNADSPVVELLE